MYWLMDRIQRGLSVISSPDCIFCSSCKNMFRSFIMYLFVVEAEEGSKQTQYFLWFVQAMANLFLVSFHSALFIGSCCSCCQACLISAKYLWQEFVCVELKITLWCKKQSCCHSNVCWGSGLFYWCTALENLNDFIPFFH